MDLSIFLSHPIQHYVPWFEILNDRLDGRFKVYYASRHGVEEAFDPEFGEKFTWDMDLLSGYEYEFLIDPEQKSGPIQGFWGVRFPHVHEVLDRDNTKAVMIFGWLFAGYWEVVWATKKIGIPYVLRAESNLLNRGGTLKWWVKTQTVGWLCRNAAMCLAIGVQNQKLFRDYGVPEDRIRVAPYFVDNDLFVGESVRLAPFRKTLQLGFRLPQDVDVVFIFMGKLVKKKHTDHLLRAWKDLPDAMKKKTALLYVGSGEIMDELKTRAKGDPRVVFAGFLNRKQLPEAYAASDVLVLPSDEGETWGLVVNEAMASGLPAIVSDRVGCAQDMVIDGQTGYIFPYGDIFALRNAMIRLIENPNIMSAMGARARKHVQIATAELAAEETIKALTTISQKNGQDR
ncbi:glycosyltransferase family 4 protein [Gammaproteobacteria bacterium]|nr:glycosyltransferase family 4 protein [Gammaproteobacteria bacterium]